MDTTTLKYIIAIADEHSITKAADKFFISQPALSQQLKKIETEIGSPLFTRDKNTWQLTDVGKVYVNGARSILHIADTSLSKLEELRILHNEKINLIVAMGLHNFVKKIILPEFSNLYPNIEINLQVGDNLQIEDYITNGLPYLAIFFGSDSIIKSFETHKIFDDEIWLCVNKNHKLNNIIEDEFDLSILKDEFFILSKSGTTHREIQEQFFLENNIAPRIIGESSSFSSAIHMLRNGYGCTFLPKALCQNKSSIFDCYKTNPISKYNICYGYSRGQIFTTPYKKLSEIIKLKFENEFSEYSSNWIKELECDILKL